MNDVVFLGIDREYSTQALNRLKKMNCNILTSHNENKKFINFPTKYDFGICLHMYYFVLYRNILKHMGIIY